MTDANNGHRFEGCIPAAIDHDANPTDSFWQGHWSSSRDHSFTTTILAQCYTGHVESEDPLTLCPSLTIRHIMDQPGNKSRAWWCYKCKLKITLVSRRRKDMNSGDQLLNKMSFGLQPDLNFLLENFYHWNPYLNAEQDLTGLADFFAM